MYILCLSAVVTVCTFKAFAASYHEPIQVEGPTINVDADSEVQAQQYVDFKFKGLKNSKASNTAGPTIYNKVVEKMAIGIASATKKALTSMNIKHAN